MSFFMSSGVSMVTVFFDLNPANQFNHSLLDATSFSSYDYDRSEKSLI